jgi:hypothetical protein
MLFESTQKTPTEEVPLSMMSRISKLIGRLLFGVPQNSDHKESPMYGNSQVYQDSNSFFIKTIAAALDVPATISDIKIAVYKHTTSGAWIKFDSEGVTIGVNIPGDGEYSERLDYMDSELLVERFWAAITNCDIYAHE